MTFSSSLVIYSSISYIVYLFVFSQTFISFKWTKLDNSARCNLPLLTEMFPNISVLKEKRQYLRNIVGSIFGI